MEQSQNSSRRMVFIGIAVAIVVIVAIVAIALTMLGTTKKEAATTATTKTAASTAVASKDEVSQNLSQVDSTIKQANTDQVAAKAAIKDGTNQVKVGN